jgi:hypothetical protein
VEEEGRLLIIGMKQEIGIPLPLQESKFDFKANSISRSTKILRMTFIVRKINTVVLRQFP